MAKIRIDRNTCCECYLCATTCSLQYNSKNTVNPKRSRIAVFFNKPNTAVINCDHCAAKPQCIDACLSSALTLAEDAG